MGQISVGVDISINSTGVCIQGSLGTHFISFPANITERKIKNSVTMVFSDLIPLPNFELIQLDRLHLDLSKKEKKDYSFSERIKLIDARNTAKAISKGVKTKLDQIIKSEGDSEIKIGFEGISHGSMGSSKIDIGGLSYLVRDELSKLCNNEVYFYAPKSLKKFAGKKLEAKTGNAGKIEMYEMFIENSLDDELLKESELFQLLKNNPELGIRKNKILKPLDDIIDAYFACRKTKTEFK